MSANNGQVQSRLLPNAYSKKSEEDSLLRLFQCDMFTMEMLIYYVWKYFNNRGVLDFLMNKLFDKPDKEVQFYMIQLCYQVLIKDSQSLETFLRDKCKQSVKMFLLISWLVQALGVAVKDRDRLTRLDDSFVMSQVNGERNSLKDQDIQIQYNAFSKESRQEYIKNIKVFISKITDISLILKKHKKEERKPLLTGYLQRLNNKIKKNRFVFKDFAYCQGFILPFCNSYDGSDNINSNMIVRIIEDDFTCFETKKRVPYRIVVETIDFEDIEKGYKPDRKKMKGYNEEEDDGNSSQSEEEVAMMTDEDDFSKNSLLSNGDQLDLQAKQKKENLAKMLQKFAEKMEINRESQGSKPKVGGFLSKVLQQVGNGGGGDKNEAKPEDSKDATMNFEDEEQFLESISKRKNKELKLKDYKEILKDKKKQVKYETNIKRFDIMFPSQKIQRRQSAGHPFLKQMLARQKQYEFLQDKQIQEPKKNIMLISDTERVEFFKQLKLDLQNAQDDKRLRKINRIYRYLKYDRIERTMELAKTHKEKGDFPRKLEPWGEKWEDKQELYKEESPYGNFPSYQCRAIIVKGGDDLRQEQMVMQIIYKFKQIFDNAGLPLWIRPYEIMVTSASSGILEFLPNTQALDGIKKKVWKYKSLYQFYKDTFKTQFEEKQQNFIRSLAGYSIVCYLLQIKDRHNGNILINDEGYMIHIDYGFVLTTSPGNIQFERAPFKLTAEYMEMMEGKNSELFNYFRSLLCSGFLELRKHVQEICLILEIMRESSDLPCFLNFPMQEFRNRFRETYTDKEFKEYVDELIYNSTDNWRTYRYDQFQKFTNGIRP